MTTVVRISRVRELFLGLIASRQFPDTHPAALYRPRQLSISSSNGGVLLGNPSLPSPRAKPGFEGVLGDSWIKKKVSDKPRILTETLEDADAGIVESNEKDPGGKDLPTEDPADALSNNPDDERLEESPHSFQTPEINPLDTYPEESQSGASFGSRFPAPSSEPDPILRQSADIGLPPGVPIFRNEDVLWRYKDPSGQIQGITYSSQPQKYTSLTVF
jgi:PERQ amino acid-rich with GYF domain-containing protein